MCSSL